MQQHRRFRLPTLTALLTLALGQTAQASDPLTWDPKA